MITLGGVDQQPIRLIGNARANTPTTTFILIESNKHFRKGVVFANAMDASFVDDPGCLMVSTRCCRVSKKTRERQRIHSTAVDPNTEIRCTSRLPLRLSAGSRGKDSQTRRVGLTDGKKRRAMVMPLAANEWRVGPSAATRSSVC